MNVSDIIDVYPQLQQILSSIPLYAVSHCHIKSFERDSAILKKGESFHSVYLLLEGSVSVINEFDEGECFRFARTQAINLLGEIEFLAEKEVCASSCIADSKCTTLQIPRKILEKWFKEDDVFFRFVVSTLAVKNYEASVNRGVESYYSSNQLFKRYLINSFTTFNEEDFPLQLAKDRQKLSEELGCCVRSINRAVKDLKSDKLISVCKGKISVSREQLSALRKSQSL